MNDQQKDAKCLIVANHGDCPEDSQSDFLTGLYSLEQRVEILREKALAVEEEKGNLLALLQKVQDNDGNLEFTDEEKEEVEAITERLICRCLTVEVAVTTPRNEGQEKALLRVNELMKQLEDMCEMKRDQALTIARSYLNACLAEPVGKAIDYRFQGYVLECTADDQKKVKQRLSNFIEQSDVDALQINHS